MEIWGIGDIGAMSEAVFYEARMGDDVRKERSSWSKNKSVARWEG